MSAFRRAGEQLNPQRSAGSHCQWPLCLLCERTIPDATGLSIKVSRDNIERIPRRVSGAPPARSGPLIKHCPATALILTPEWPGNSRSSWPKLVPELYCRPGLLSWIRKNPFPAHGPVTFRNLFPLTADHSIVLSILSPTRNQAWRSRFKRSPAGVQGIHPGFPIDTRWVSRILHQNAFGSGTCGWSGSSPTLHGAPFDLCQLWDSQARATCQDDLGAHVSRRIMSTAGAGRFRMTVIGEMVSSVVMFIRKRPSAATSYCGLTLPAIPPKAPLSRVWNRALGVARLHRRALRSNRNGHQLRIR